ncbi:hypothetical protein CLAM6_16170 [Cobetia sp. AM6]|nr:hypothetical protein CLAM6_16170 [Cobetia sp. AM6]|tara:strand:- start:53 stop:475 length:423 start_codon:yes stop_codon:yes gene_type:complete
MKRVIPLSIFATGVPKHFRQVLNKVIELQAAQSHQQLTRLCMGLRTHLSTRLSTGSRTGLKAKQREEMSSYDKKRHTPAGGEIADDALAWRRDQGADISDMAADGAVREAYAPCGCAERAGSNRAAAQIRSKTGGPQGDR